MNREILFRGKIKKNGEWSYGNLVTDIQGVRIITPDLTPIGIYGQVIPDTVGQYTGLNDASGKKIFEGDIVNVNSEEIGQIEWFTEAARFMIVIDNIITDFDNYYGNELVVIGNVHDNPELLEVE